MAIEREQMRISQQHRMLLEEVLIMNGALTINFFHKEMKKNDRPVSSIDLELLEKQPYGK